MPQVNFALLLVVFSAFTTFSPSSLFNYCNNFKVVFVVQGASRLNLVEVKNLFS
jgi:hypothetical protein